MECHSVIFEITAEHANGANLRIQTGAKLKIIKLFGWNALMLASLKGDVNIVELLLEYKANYNQADNMGFKALDIACANGHIEIVKLLLKQSAYFTDIHTDVMTALWLASTNGNVTIARLLHEFGADFLKTSVNDLDSLMMACIDGLKVIVEILLINGANVKNTNKEGLNALMLATNYGHTEVVKLLLSYKADFNQTNIDGWDCLMFACSKGHVEVVKLLLQSGAKNKSIDTNGCCALMLASFKGHTEVVKLLLEYKADFNQADNKGWSSLMIACNEGHVKVVKLLLQSGAEDKIFDTSGCNCLMLASQSGNVEVVKLLFVHNADLNHKNNIGLDSLMVACIEGHTEIATLLLQRGSSVKTVSKGGCSALMLASQNGHLEIVKLLLEYKVDFNQIDNDGWSSLMFACSEGHVEVAKLLLEQRAKVENTDKDGYNAIMLASQFGNVEIIKLLLDYKADFNQTDHDGWSSLMFACNEGYTEIVNLLLQSFANVEYTDKDGYNALMLASKNGHLEVVKLLLKYKGMSRKDKNVGCSETEQVLRNAVHEKTVLMTSSRRQKGVVSGVNVNVTNKFGRDSLMYSSMNGHANVVEQLLNFEANLSCLDNMGFDALFLAVRNGHVSATDLLILRKLNDRCIDKSSAAGTSAILLIENEAMYMLGLGFLSFEKGHTIMVDKLREYFVIKFKECMAMEEVQLILRLFDFMSHLLNMKSYTKDTAKEKFSLNEISVIVNNELKTSFGAERYIACYLYLTLNHRTNQLPTCEELLKLTSDTTKELASKSDSNVLLFYIYNKCLIHIFETFDEMYKEKRMDLILELLEHKYIENTVKFIKQRDMLNVSAPSSSLFLAHEILNILQKCALYSEEFSLRLAECGICKVFFDHFSLFKDEKELIRCIAQQIILIILFVAISKDGLEYLNRSNVLEAIKEFHCDGLNRVTENCLHIVTMCSDVHKLQAHKYDFMFYSIRNALRTVIGETKKYKTGSFLSKVCQELEQFFEQSLSMKRLLDIDESLENFAKYQMCSSDGNTQEYNDEAEYALLDKSINALKNAVSMQKETTQVNEHFFMWSICRNTGKFSKQDDQFVSPDVPEQFTIQKELLGRGAFGSVHIVIDIEHPNEKKFVAKKLNRTHMECSKKFENETSILMHTIHRRIVRFHGFLKRDFGLFLFFEYVQMGTLSQFINAETNLDEKTTRRFTIQILDGLFYLHEKGILHRDIKGSNILMEDSQNIKITDFGISELLDGKGVVTKVGTLTYMAPELMSTNGNKIFNYKSDIWSVGCTVVEMLTGNPPNSLLLPAQIAFRVRAKKPLLYELPTPTSVELKQFLDKTLQWEPHLRPTAHWLLTNDPFVLPKREVEVYSKLA